MPGGKMLNDYHKILVIAPHTDDGEFGCGGTISKLVEDGKEVYYAYFSICEESVPQKFPKDVLAEEAKKATKELGIKETNLIPYRYPVRKFPEYRQSILEDLIKIKEKINPEIVFLPSSADIHQDHSTIFKEGRRAFKKVSILGYELPWDNFELPAKAFVHLDEKHISEKIKAINEYKSQEHRKYMSEKFVRSLSYARGIQAGAEYAEAFEIVRWNIK